MVCDGFCSGGSSGSSRISSFSAPSALLSATPPAVPPSSLSPSRPPGVSGLLLLPLAPFPWPVSLALALGSYLVVGDSTVALGSSHFSVTPFLLSLPSGVVHCIGSPFVLLCSAGLLCGFIWLCPFLHSLRFGPGGSAHQPGPSSVFPPLSGASATPSVLLSQCLVTVLLSLCSWFVGPVAPGAAGLQFLRLSFLIFDCLRSRWCLTYISIGIW